MVGELNLVLHRMEQEQVREKLELLRERDPERAEVLLRSMGDEEFIRWCIVPHLSKVDSSIFTELGGY